MYPLPAGAAEREDLQRPSHEGRPAASCRAKLIDTGIVRAELVRLRRPRPRSEVRSAHTVRSSATARA